MKKLIEAIKSALTAFNEARGISDTKAAAAKLEEAEQKLAKAVEAEGEGEGEGESEALCAKKEGESDEAHKERLTKLHAHLSKMLGAEAEGEGEDDGDGDDDGKPADGAGDGDMVIAKGKHAISHVVGKGKKDDGDAQEARRLAVKQLLAEAKLPPEVVKAIRVEKLAQVPLAEAKAEIAKYKALVETLEARAAGITAHFSESMKPASNQEIFSGVAR